MPPTSKTANSIANSGANWAFGGVPMGNTGIGVPRPGPMSSFAQTIGASSQPSTPLDLSEFPSLSENQPHQSQSTSTAAGARNIGPSTNMRLTQQSSISTQQHLGAQIPSQQQQEDLFNSAQIPSSQGVFRFGNPNTAIQNSQSNGVDEFPPLNRNINGEIGQGRGYGLIQNSGFSAPSNGLSFNSTNPTSTPSCGLLSAISNSARNSSGSISVDRLASSVNPSSVWNSRSPTDSNRTGLNTVPECEPSDAQALSNAKLGDQEVTSLTTDTFPDPSTSQRSQNLDSNGQCNSEETGDGREVHDVMAGMSEIDKWGLKGFSMMMNNYPAYAALVTGSDLTSLRLDLSSSENISNQVYSLWENEPPRLAMPPYKLPDCYTVTNVAQLETKMTNFNDEALLFMFYSNPGDLQQVMAAQELHNRNWRYHKKLQLWLTKDEMMVPQTIGNGTERGYYIFFDIKNWQRERREFTLIYEDLESLPNANPRLG
ncbi:BgTH12-01523 [Blumeria graminis f. sp. triticale]|nr:BgTH12-01523 [Blumeria graminis f. sp. triticale]